MRKTAFILFLGTLLSLSPLVSQSSVEIRILQNVQKMLQQGGRVIFSDLYNSPEFSPQEKAFLGHLYETFFQIPALLRSEYENGGKIPTRQEIADRLGLSTLSVDLLLTVMESDTRVPPLFDRDAESKEIRSLNLENIEGFIANRGTEVRLTQWEGTTLPEFQLQSFKGDRVSSDDLGGKNSLIYFWFTGCPPCMRIAPILADLNRKYSQSNFQVIGFNADRVLGLDTTDQERESYLQKNQLDFAQLHVDQGTRQAFGNVNVFPTLYFVGKDRVIFEHMVNFQDQDTLEGVITTLIGE